MSIYDSTGIVINAYSGRIAHHISGDVGVVSGSGEFYITNNATLILDLENGTINGGENIITGYNLSITGGTNYISGIDPTNLEVAVRLNGDV